MPLRIIIYNTEDYLVIKSHRRWHIFAATSCQLRFTIAYGLYPIQQLAQRHSPSEAIIAFRKVGHKSELSIHMVNCQYVHQESPSDTQTPAHFKRTAPPPVLSPSNILPPPFSHFTFITSTKNRVHFKTVIL